MLGVRICHVFWLSINDYDSRENTKLPHIKLHIAQLAIVNFIFSFVQVINVTPLYWTNRWLYGPLMCKLTKGTLEIGSLLSSVFFQLIIVQRYFIVVRGEKTYEIKKAFEHYKHHLLVVNVLLVGFTAMPFVHELGIEPVSQRCTR